MNNTPARDGETRDEQPSRWVQRRPEVPGPPEMVCRYCGKRPGQATHKGTASAYCTCDDAPARDGETLSAPPTTCGICGSATGNPSHGNCTPTYCRATQATVRAYVAALRAELADARADTGRLDWLDAEHGRVDPVARLVVKRFYNRDGHEWADCAYSARREIDAARSASGEDASHA